MKKYVLPHIFYSGSFEANIQTIRESLIYKNNSLFRRHFHCLPQSILDFVEHRSDHATSLAFVRFISVVHMCTIRVTWEF